MDFSTFDELPDYLSEETLKKYFNQVIRYYDCTESVRTLLSTINIYLLDNLNITSYHHCYSPNTYLRFLPVFYLFRNFDVHRTITMWGDYSHLN